MTAHIRSIVVDDSTPLCRGLTPAVSGRRPAEAFHVQQEPQAGGGHVHGAG